MSIIYDSLHLETLNPRTVQFSEELIVEYTIDLDSQETTDTDRQKIVREKIKVFDGVYTKPGILIPGTAKILREPIFIANMSDFRGSVRGTVWISGKYYNPRLNSVIVGVKCIEDDASKGIGFTYRGNTIIQVDANLLSEDEKKYIKKDSYYTIKCIAVKKNLGHNTAAIEGTLFKLMNISLEKRMFVLRNKIENLSDFKLISGTQNGYLTNSNTDKLIDFYKKFDEYSRINFDQLYKKLVNPYELLYASRFYRPKNFDYEALYSKFPVLIKDPVSRAFFKVLELIFFFKLMPEGFRETALTLGDAPGGFAQCITQMFPGVKVGTVSLLDKKEIQYDNRVKTNKDITIDGLADGTGDLLSVKNMRYLHEKYSGVHFVGCDGALAYEDKERDHFRLLFAEIIHALGSLAKGGSAVFKLYRIWDRITFDLYLLLHKYFDVAYIYKCRSSRIASLETFYIGKNFRGISSNELDNLIKIYEGLTDDHVSICDWEIDERVKTMIHAYNSYFDKVVLFHHRLILEYHNYEGNQIDREPFYRNQMEYARGFFMKSGVA